MIENTNKTKTKTPHLAKKFYYLVMSSNNPVGVATNYDTAKEYLSNLAIKLNAKKIAEDIYTYSDVTGTHLLTVQEVIRIKD